MAAGAPAVIARSEGWAAQRRAVHLLKADIAAPPDFLRGLKQRREELSSEYMPIIARLATTFLGADVTVTALPALGTFHSLFRLQDEHNRGYIMRTALLDTPDGTPDFIIDYWVAGLGAKWSVPVSAPLWVDVSQSNAPFPFEVFHESTALTVKQLENSTTQALPDGVAHEMGRTLASIHEVVATGAGPLDVAALTDDVTQPPRGVHDKWQQFVLLNLDEHLVNCQAASSISADEVATITSLFKTLETFLQNGDTCLLHGDYSGSNLFTNGTSISAVFDWEDALAGDPVYDIAAWATFYREPIHREFLDGYRSLRDLHANFEVKFWLYYLRVSLAKTAHRYRFGMGDVPGRQPASRRIQQALDHLCSRTIS